jgi:CRISPR-associated endonuclease/helicase Cas3
MNSVVILDEAQMLPPDLLLPCMEALRELTTRYNTTIVLCTATQPALNREDEFPGGFENVREIIPDREILYESLKRVEITMIGKKKDEEIAALIREQMQALCIVNTRKRARKLFELCETQEGVYHLSAAMCPTHRTQKLDEIRERLCSKKHCKVISTQLIEAGVDIDFPVVFREMTGIDSIAQAAGRCNREGKLPRYGEVYIFEPSDGTPTLFRQQAQAAQTVIRHHGDDVLSLDGIREYFRELYWTKGRERLDILRIIDRLKPGADSLNFPFREIGEQFRLIAEDTVPVIIPWGKEGKDLEKSLRATKPSRAIFRKTQRFTVSVYRQVFNQLEASGVVEKIPESVAILTNMEIYSDDLGLKLNDTYYRSPESNII